ncbi:MAG: glycosyltransferase family 4 protein [bacterium]
MKIAVLSTFDESVPPPKYGGIELVIANFIEVLTKQGHDVTLFATGDSKTNAHLIPTFPKAFRKYDEFQNAKLRDSMKVKEVAKIVSHLSKNKYDIIHNNIGWRILAFEEMLASPIVTTLHGPLEPEDQNKIYGSFPETNYVSISMNQRNPLPNVNYVANVYNGLDTKKFKYFDRPQDYYAFLGRFSPEKGPVQAIEIAKKASVKLKMAAKIDPHDSEFYEKEVKPLIDGDQIEYIGEIGHKEKVELLGNAKALIAPIQWEEPFGLFFVESMICGTPVLATDRGSTKELIIDGETGFLRSTTDELAAKIPEIEKLDRRKCHEHAQENFSKEKMAAGYLEAYEKVIKK